MKDQPTTANTPARPRARKKGAWKRFIPYAFFGALLIAIIVGLIPKPIPVEVASVNHGPLTVTVLEEGKTRIRHRYVVSPPVSGLLKRIELRAGDPIQAGKTVLAIIQAEPPGFLNPRARSEAEARVRVAEAARMRSDAEVERVRETLALAEKERVRASTLKTRGAISVKEWEAADNQVAVLHRELRGAEFGLQVAQFEIRQAEAALQQIAPADLAMEGGPRTSEPLRILAPIDGFVLNVNEENSRIVAAGTALMELGDPNDLECEIELLSSDAVGVRPGAEVSIERWGGEKPLQGRVTIVEPGGFTKVSALGIEEQRVKVRVDFVDPLPAGRLIGDRFRIEARIVTWSSPRVLQVATGALFRRGNDWLAFLIDDGRARAVRVEIAHNNGSAADVRSGLTEGQTVILHPPDAVADGTAVRPRVR